MKMETKTKKETKTEMVAKQTSIATLIEPWNSTTVIMFHSNPVLQTKTAAIIINNIIVFSSNVVKLIYRLM